MRSTIASLGVVTSLLVLQPFAAAVLASGETPVLLLLDEDSIDNGRAPLFLSAEDVNDHITAAGVRDPLPYFASSIGRQITLPSGGASDHGWFAIDHAPQSWGLADIGGFQNFVLAGPGLGSPDANGDRESLLTDILGVSALETSDLASLVGRTVCAVVYDDDLAPAGGGSTTLQGSTLGVVAFNVLAITPADAAQSGVEIEILDSATTCAGDVTSMSGAQ